MIDIGICLHFQKNSERIKQEQNFKKLLIMKEEIELRGYGWKPDFSNYVLIYSTHF